MFKPILFNTEMVQAILKGEKTSTRRIIKPQPKKIIKKDSKDRKPLAFWKDYSEWIKPPYQPGDTLWVRETWTKPPVFLDGKQIYQYKADYDNKAECKWKPSIFMPKAAARIFLKVTDVKVQKLQDITEDEAKAEGATPQIWYQPYGTKDEGKQRYIGDIVHQEINYKTGFADIWDKTVNKEENSFQANPWVWVVEFKRIKKEEINE